MRFLATILVLGGLCLLTTGCTAGQQSPLRPARQVSVVEGSSAATPTPGFQASTPLPASPDAAQASPALSRYAMFLTPRPTGLAQTPAQTPMETSTPSPVPATATPTTAPPTATPGLRPSPSPTSRQEDGEDRGQGSRRGSNPDREASRPLPTPTPLAPASAATPVQPSPTPAQGGEDRDGEMPLLSVAPSRASLAVGEVIPVEVVLSEAPAGLSGFDLAVTVQDGGVVELVKAELADFGLVSTSPVPSSSVRLRAADLNEVVSAGMQQVVLARLYLRGLAPGSAVLSIGLTGLDDERGYPLSVKLSPATINTR